MHLSIVSMAALASAPLAFAQLPNTPVAPTVPTTTPRPTAPTLPAAPVLPTNLPTTLPGLFAYPIKQVLPVPGWNTTTESFDTLATLYSNSSQQLYAQVVALAQRNVELSGSGGIQYSYDVQANLASSLAIVNNLFWKTGYEAERKVCAIVSSINEQNVDLVKGNLAVAISAQVQLILSVTITLTNTIAAIQAQLSQFTEAERTVVSTLIQAIATAAASSTGPIVNLNAGLAATGVTALNEVVQSLQTAIVGLQSAAAINWTIA